MPYSVLPPPSGSPNWMIIDESGEVVFSGQHEHCEEWLDLADFSKAVGGWSPGRVTDAVMDRLKIFELATALLRRW
jgi:hypothetical protein